MPRLAYASDLHGRADLYSELLALARAHDAVPVVGGDLLPHTSTRDRAIELQAGWTRATLGPLLAAHQAAGGAPPLLIPGNDDWLAATAELANLAATGLCHQLHMRAFQLDCDLSIAGYACVQLTPFTIKDWERPEAAGVPPYTFEHALVSTTTGFAPLTAADFAARPTIAQELAELAGLSDPMRTVYVCHVPPAASGLDTARGGRPVGSRDLRRFIEERQPPLTLHGHVHEAPSESGRWATQIGATWCVNPGQGAQLHAVLLDPADIAASMRHTLYR